MGRFFSNIQIYNNQNQEQFIKSFCKQMQKQGFCIGTEDDSSISYVLAFSENSDWITLNSADYESGGEHVKNDIQSFAEALNTCCISISVVDSDFSILEMYNGTSFITDTVLVGDGSGYGFEDDTQFQGKQECWEPLLKGNSTWEKFSELCEKHSTFTEDSLWEIAQLLGINPQDIVSDYEDLSSRTDENIVKLYFKKKGKRALSLNTAFKQVFGEALEPLGFKKIKGKHPYFVRSIDGEILHIVTYRKLQVRKMGYQTFEILGGIITLYQRNIDFTKSPDNWLKTNLYFYRNSNLELEVDEDFKKSIINFYCDVWGVSKNRLISMESFDGAFIKSIIDFYCKLNDSEAMLASVKNAFNVTKQVMLPIFDKVTDLNSCIDYFYKIDSFMDLCDDIEKFMTDNFYYYSDGLLLIKNSYRDDGIKRMERKLVVRVREIENGFRGLGGAKDIKDYCNRYDEYRQKQVAIRDKILDNPNLNAKVMAELEWRKAKNIEILKSYGLEI